MMILKRKKEKAKIDNDNLIKGETIKHLYKEQINTLNILLENQQILALESNKKIQNLENQLEKDSLIIPLIRLLMIDKILICK